MFDTETSIQNIASVAIGLLAGVLFGVAKGRTSGKK